MFNRELFQNIIPSNCTYIFYWGFSRCGVISRDIQWSFWNTVCWVYVVCREVLVSWLFKCKKIVEYFGDLLLIVLWVKSIIIYLYKCLWAWELWGYWIMDLCELDNGWMSWVLQLFSGNFRKFSGNFLEISRRFPGKFLEFSRTFLGNLPEISRKCPEHVPKNSRKFPGNFLKISRKIHWGGDMFFHLR